MNAAIESPPTVYIFARAYENGSSKEAELVRSRFAQAVDEIQKSIALTKNCRLGREALIEAYNDARLANWDGYGAQPVSFESYCRADRFLKLFPNDLPLPDVSTHPDGEIVFEWRTASGKILSVSIGRGNTVTYAGIFGSTERYGVENFIDEIPSDIRGMFSKLFTE
jgi:hypothetical protein